MVSFFVLHFLMSILGSIIILSELFSKITLYVLVICLAMLLVSFETTTYKTSFCFKKAKPTFRGSRICLAIIHETATFRVTGSRQNKAEFMVYLGIINSHRLFLGHPSFLSICGRMPLMIIWQLFGMGFWSPNINNMKAICIPISSLCLVQWYLAEEFRLPCIF